MENSYGSIIVKKGTILYNLSDNKDNNISNIEFNMCFYQKILFCVFHPSEGDIISKYVHYIKLKKDLKLLFMIEGFNGIRIQSFFKFFTNIEYSTIKVFNYNNQIILQNYIEKLINEKFDGWITSIDNSNNLEIAIINDYNYFKYNKKAKLKIDWINRHIKNENIENKYWGNNYKISFITIPIEIKLNNRYKKMINKYKKYAIKKKYIFDNIFQLLLEHSIITYHKSDMKRIIWY